MPEKILNCLETGEWMETLDIAKAVVGRDGTKRDVNNCLYGLGKQGHLEMRPLPGNKHRKQWKLAASVPVAQASSAQLRPSFQAAPPDNMISREGSLLVHQSD